VIVGAARGAVLVREVTRTQLLTAKVAGRPPVEKPARTSRTRTAPRARDITVASNAGHQHLGAERRIWRRLRGCRAKFDRAFMQILLDRLSMANLRLSV